MKLERYDMEFTIDTDNDYVMKPIYAWSRFERFKYRLTGGAPKKITLGEYRKIKTDVINEMLSNQGFVEHMGEVHPTWLDNMGYDEHRGGRDGKL